MTRRVHDKALREWSICWSEIYSREILPLRLSIDGHLDIEGCRKRSSRPLGKTGNYGTGS
jgi:hypothetical protein